MVGVLRFPPLALVGVVALGCATVELEDLETPAPVPEGSCVIVGFLGGLDSWDDPDKDARRLALEMRGEEGRYAETLENRRLDLATELVRRSLDADKDGGISATEARRVRWVVYGQSLGGNSANLLAWRLWELGVDVPLLLLLDSVGPWDEPVPPSVAVVAALFQDDGWIIRGEATPERTDPAATDLVLREYEYGRPPGSEIEIGDLSWSKLAFRIAHSRMDRDPRVWATARDLVAKACAETPAVGPIQNRSPRASRR